MSHFLVNFIEAGKGHDYRRLDELQRNVIYKVFKFSLKQTNFGMGLIGEVEDPDTLESFTMFFPERMARKVRSEDELEELNEENLSFIFKGRENRVAILEFIKS